MEVKERMKIYKRTKEPESIFGMANLNPKHTGLAVDIWADHNGISRPVSHRGTQRVKIGTRGSFEMSVTIEGVPRILEKSGTMKASDLKKCEEAIRYVGRNADLFLKHYMDASETFDDDDLINALRVRGDYMKKLVKTSEYISAMALINPRLCKSRTILVEVEQLDEGPIPHVHVYHDKTRDPKRCSYIRLDKAEYLTHHGGSKGIPLPPNLKKEFIEVMDSPWERHIIETTSGLRPATGYEAAVLIWEDTYEDGSFDKFEVDEEGKLIIPDYGRL